MLYISYTKRSNMLANEKITENRIITDRFLAIMYQLIGLRKIKTKKQFAESVGLTSSNIYRMEIENTMNVPLYAIRMAYERYNINLEYIFTGKGKMFNE